MVRLKRVPVGDAALTDEKQDAMPAPTTAPAKKTRRRRGRTSSERGKEFRKRQDNYEALLEQQVTRLKQEIVDKQFLLGVWEAKYLRTKHSIHGLLVGKTVEYFRLFQFGLRSNSETLESGDRSLIERQEAFVYSIMDPLVVIGSSLRGPEAVLEQWRLLTQATPGMSLDIIAPPIVVHPCENPILEIQLRGSHRVTPQFVDVVFDASVRHQALSLLKLSMGQSLKSCWRVYLQFTAAMRIQLKLVQVDYVQSFLGVGLSLREVTELLRISRITAHSTIEAAGTEEKKTPTVWL